MGTKKKVFISILIAFLVLVGYMVLDYINILGIMSLKVERINGELLSVFAPNLLVILLYVITYFIVDEKNAKERKNKKEIVKYMLEDDYNTCLRYLDVLENKMQLKIIVEQLSKDGCLYKNEYFNEWMDVSFKNYNYIMEYSSQGIIDVKILKKYLYIKSQYLITMSGYILSAGMPDEMEKIIEEGHKNLKKKGTRRINKFK